MARTYQFLIGKAEAGRRLDQYLARHLPAWVSRRVIQRAIREGMVTVGERPVKAHYKVRLRDAIIARMAELPAPSTNAVLTPQPIPLDIVYEDPVLLVVNKPPGLVTHPAPGHWDGTLVNAILWHLGQGPPLSRAGIVHRLDKDTSGLLIVAKTVAAHTVLSRQLKARAISRRYLALVDGTMSLDHGTVNAAIGRHLKHRKIMTVQHLGGRAAVTHYRVIARMAAPFPHALLEVSLETGRTHQIRVHMAHLGHPVLGDMTYGRHPASYWASHGISRQLLHAYAIRFLHPSTRQPVELRAPIPDDMRRWIEKVPGTS